MYKHRIYVQTNKNSYIHTLAFIRSVDMSNINVNYLYKDGKNIQYIIMYIQWGVRNILNQWHEPALLSLIGLIVHLLAYPYHYTALEISNCIMDMRYVDAHKTKCKQKKKIRMKRSMYTWLTSCWLNIYSSLYAHMNDKNDHGFLFGKRTGRQDAIQIKESWLWGRPADMM